jgi:hypothetical protein
MSHVAPTTEKFRIYGDFGEEDLLGEGDFDEGVALGAGSSRNEPGYAQVPNRAGGRRRSIRFALAVAIGAVVGLLVVTGIRLLGEFASQLGSSQPVAGRDAAAGETSAHTRATSVQEPSAPAHRAGSNSAPQTGRARARHKPPAVHRPGSPRRHGNRGRAAVKASARRQAAAMSHRAPEGAVPEFGFER